METIISGTIVYDSYGPIIKQHKVVEYTMKNFEWHPSQGVITIGSENYYTLESFRQIMADVGQAEYFARNVLFRPFTIPDGVLSDGTLIMHFGHYYYFTECPRGWNEICKVLLKLSEIGEIPLDVSFTEIGFDKINDGIYNKTIIVEPYAPIVLCKSYDLGRIKKAVARPNARAIVAEFVGRIHAAKLERLTAEELADIVSEIGGVTKYIDAIIRMKSAE